MLGHTHSHTHSHTNIGRPISISSRPTEFPRKTTTMYKSPEQKPAIAGFCSSDFELEARRLELSPRDDQNRRKIWKLSLRYISRAHVHGMITRYMKYWHNIVLYGNYQLTKFRHAGTIFPKPRGAPPYGTYHALTCRACALDT